MIKVKNLKYLFTHAACLGENFDNINSNLNLDQTEINNQQKRNEIVKKTSIQDFLDNNYKYISVFFFCIVIFFVFYNSSSYKQEKNFIEFCKNQNPNSVSLLNDQSCKNIDLNSLFGEDDCFFYIHKKDQNNLISVASKSFNKLWTVNSDFFFQCSKSENYQASYDPEAVFNNFFSCFFDICKSKKTEMWLEKYENGVKEISKKFPNKIIKLKEFFESYTNVFFEEEIGMQREIFTTVFFKEKKGMKREIADERKMSDFLLDFLSNYLLLVQTFLKKKFGENFIFDQSLNLVIKKQINNNKEKKTCKQKIEEKKIFDLYNKLKSVSFFFIDQEKTYVCFFSKGKNIVIPVKKDLFELFFSNNKNPVIMHLLGIINKALKNEEPLKKIFNLMLEAQNKKLIEGIRSYKVQFNQNDKIDIFNPEVIQKFLLNEKEFLQILKKEYPLD